MQDGVVVQDVMSAEGGDVEDGGQGASKRVKSQGQVELESNRLQ